MASGPRRPASAACIAAVVTMIAAGCAAMATSAHATIDDRLTDRTHHNLQCFIVTSSIAADKDKKSRSAGALASVFLAGQIFGELPDIDIDAALAAEWDGLEPRALPVLAKSCGDEMARRGAQIEHAGDALK